ncbi:hypothetical protein BIZ37_13430 [Photobacterium sp. BZF1]|uniref:hypothetical protein n=1 Tax=Photobacterium sp. BZF1 TaxID=1904457 RepID=UPI0016534F4E|nr:hypothetical protein [Photobacterium sp. BZF1]MBC7003562.1 hypothetical protein [Photobacterium sp. BZF1]
MTEPKLNIVIHAEEEFDWDGGFYRSNTEVTHHDNLIDFIHEIIHCGGTVTLAMDYPFVTSQGGKKVINEFKGYAGECIEFASHLHPWVTPPFEDDCDRISDHFSFPCNLTKKMEYEKLKRLTDSIEDETGIRPITYLAGRYGIGENTTEVLKSLGYKVDLSISAYTNFSHAKGPDFSQYTCKPHISNDIYYIPHTCSVVASSKVFEDHLNSNPEHFRVFNENRALRLLSKPFGVKKYRLSPEGFTLKHMIAATENQLRIGQSEFILSFHSPSVKIGLTPYVHSEKELSTFKSSVLDYIKWFETISNSSNFLPMRMIS